MNQELEALVPILVEAVLRRLGPGLATAGGAPARRNVAQDDRGPLLLVWLGAGPVRSTEPLRVATESAGRWAARQLLFVPEGSRAAEVGAGRAEVRPYDPSAGSLEPALAAVSEADLVVCFGLGWSQAQALAEARDEDPAVRVCLEALGSGRKVHLLADPGLGGLAAALEWTRSGLAGGRGPLGRRAERLARDLERLGARWTRPGEVAAVLAGISEAASPEAKALGGLVTQRAVAEAHGRGLRVLYLTRDTVVTPLAREEARRLGVELRRVEW